MTRGERVVLLGGIWLATAAMLGCANNRANERDDDRAEARDDRRDDDRNDNRADARRISSPEALRGAISTARASIADAERAGGNEYGGAQLALAHDKLRAAEEAAQDGEIERGRRLAVEADLDANLAMAIARNRETQALVIEVREGLETLEQEVQRGSARPAPLQ
jgi:hypothetical protein